MSGKPVDSAPEHFDSYEDAAEFWDTHDTADYLDEFRTVEVKSEFRVRRFEVEIEGDVVRALAEKAKREGVSLSHLASELWRQQLPRAA